MQYTAIVQARLSSSRLPRKVLKQVKGKTLLDYQIESLCQCSALNQIIIATSNEASDDELAKHCQKMGYSFVRGPLDDVAGRFVLALETVNPENFVRFCADRPFYDHRVLEQAIHIFDQGHWDILSNAVNPTFPKGQTTEILRTDCFLENYPKFSEPQDFEHVTPYFYRNSEDFRIFDFTTEQGNFSAVNLCVDTLEDFERFAAIVEKTTPPLYDYSWQTFVKLYNDYNQGS